MPLHDYTCKKCKETDERYVRFADMNQDQRCECGGVMERQFNFAPYFAGRQKPKSMSRPTIRGMDSGPGGLLTGNVMRGCGSNAQLSRLKKNLAKEGRSLGGDFFVPGLCRKGVQEDPHAVCSDWSEAAQKAEALGRCLETADGLLYESTVRDEHLAKTEGPYRCSEKVVQPDVNREVKEKHGGKVSSSKRKEITEKFVDLHSGNG